jgi:pyridoxine/pyridoxamine 5'-phosphate oxidase
MTDRDSVREFLAAPRCAVLSTLDAHGAPHQTVLHYFLGEDGLVVNGRPDRLWAKNLRRDPRVSVRRWTSPAATTRARRSSATSSA